MTMRICLIFNPQAAAVDELKELLLRLGPEHRCEVRATASASDAAQMAAAAARDGLDRIIVAGGDGTVNQVISGLAPDFPPVELGVFPLGTGNDLARSLGVPPDRPDLAASIVLGDRVEEIDVMQVVGQPLSWCVNVANGGFGGRVASDVQAVDKQRWGPLAYWITGVTRLIDLEPFRVALTLDDQQLELDAYGVAVANGRFVGGGFPIAPRALLNDGLLDVTTIPVLPTFELMAAGLNFTLGRNHRDDRVRSYRARRVEIRAEPEMPFSMDGEPTCRLDAAFEVLPKALRVVVGEQPAGLIDTPTTGQFAA